MTSASGDWRSRSVRVRSRGFLVGGKWVEIVKDGVDGLGGRCGWGIGFLIGLFDGLVGFLVGVLLECVFVWETIVRFLMEILYEIRVRNFIEIIYNDFTTRLALG